MAQQDFERFKQEIKEWLDSHPEEYDRFVAETNDKSAIGLYKVFNVGMRLAPKLMRRYRTECHGDLADGRHFIKKHEALVLQGLVLRRQYSRVEVEELIEKEIDEHRAFFELIGRHLKVDAHALAADFSKVKIVGGCGEVDARVLKN